MSPTTTPRSPSTRTAYRPGFLHAPRRSRRPRAPLACGCAVLHRPRSARRRCVRRMSPSMPTTQPRSGVGEVDAEERLLGGRGRVASRCAPPSVVARSVPNSPHDEAVLRIGERDVVENDVVGDGGAHAARRLLDLDRSAPSERSSQVAPPSLVETIAPQSPTAHAVRGVDRLHLEEVLRRSTAGVFCAFQVLPPSAVWRIECRLADRPAVLRVGEVDAEERLLACRCRRACQVLPPSVVCVDRRRSCRPPTLRWARAPARRRDCRAASAACATRAGIDNASAKRSRRGRRVAHRWRRYTAAGARVNRTARQRASGELRIA